MHPEWLVREHSKIISELRENNNTFKKMESKMCSWQHTMKKKKRVPESINTFWCLKISKYEAEFCCSSKPSSQSSTTTEIAIFQHAGGQR